MKSAQLVILVCFFVLRAAAAQGKGFLYHSTNGNQNGRPGTNGAMVVSNGLLGVGGGYYYTTQ